MERRLRPLRQPRQRRPRGADPAAFFRGYCLDRDPRLGRLSDAVSYEILRDDRPIATSDTTSVEVPRGGENRFFVRAVDAEGNRSATTPVYTAPAYGQVDPASPVLLEAGAT